MKLKKFIKLIDYRVTETEPFQWECYGPKANFFSYTSRDLRTCVQAIADLETQKVYEINVTRIDGNGKDLAVRWFDPDYKKAYVKEAKKRKLSPTIAWDSVEFQDVSNKNTIKEVIKTVMKV